MGRDSSDSFIMTKTKIAVAQTTLCVSLSTSRRRDARGRAGQVIASPRLCEEGQSTTNDEAAERPMQVWREQKMAKDGRIVEQNNLALRTPPKSFGGLS